MNLITLDDLKKWEAAHQDDESAHIKSASEWADATIDYFHNPEQRNGDPLPWGKAFGQFDLRPAEVTMWLGFNGHGKSLMQGQIMTSLMQLGRRVMIASMEMRPVATLARMCRQASGGSSPSVDYIRAWHRWTDGRLWLYDQNGTINVQRALTLAKYSATELKADHIVIDSLMKCTPREDDYGAQKELIDGLCCCARDTGTHIHIIHHSRKQTDESQIPGKMDAKGSGVLSDMVDNVASVWRNKDKRDDEAPDAVLAIDKQRHGEWEGKIGLWFHAPSQQYVGARNASPIQLCNVGPL